MIWGCFSYHSVGRVYVCDGIMTFEKYLHVLQEKLLPSIYDLKFWFLIIWMILISFGLFWCHRTIAVKEWYKENKTNQIEWPGYSTDINPIENLWSILKQKLRRKIITKKTQLIEKVIKVWHHEIPKEVCQALSD